MRGKLVQSIDKFDKRKVALVASFLTLRFIKHLSKSDLGTLDRNTLVLLLKELRSNYGGA